MLKSSTGFRKLYFLPPFILQTAIWIPCYIIFRLIFISLKVKGLENIKNLDRGVIFAPNHTSELDAILIPASLPFLSKLMPMFYTSREKSFYKRSGWRQYIYGGLFFEAWGAYRVFTGLENYDYALKNHIQILEDGGSLTIFPEGYRTLDGNLREPKAGVAFLSHKTLKPIIPVAISGLFGMTLLSFLTCKHKVIVHFGKPLYFGDILRENKNVSHVEYKNASQKVMESIKAVLP